MIERVKVLVCAITMCLLSSCSKSSTPTNGEGELEMSAPCFEVLNRLREIVDVTSEGKIDFTENRAEWRTRLELAGEQLLGVVQNGKWNCLEELLDQIGSDDSAVAFLVLCSAPRLTFPVNPSFTEFELAQSNRLQLTTQQYSEIRLEAAQIVAEWFYAAPESWRERYYNGLLWSRIDSIRSREGYVSYIRNVVAGFDESADNEQWWYVRSAMILMYAAEEDLEFDELTPESVHEVFDKWAEVVLSEQNTLIPSSDHKRWRRGGTIANLLASDYLDGADESPLPGWTPSGLTYVDVEIHLDATPF